LSVIVFGSATMSEIEISSGLEDSEPDVCIIPRNHNFCTAIYVEFEILYKDVVSIVSNYL